MRRFLLLLLTAPVLAGWPAAAAAQETPQPHGSADRDAFQPLLADLKEPRFFANYYWEGSGGLASQLSTVGLGQTIGLARFDDDRLQISLSAGVFSQFDMRSPATDLINTDFIVGFPVSYRSGSLSGRLRLYHQSSHLGDEFLLNTGAQRLNLTFESAELLVSGDVGRWRIYGGGEYLFHRDPTDLEPGILHTGVEYRASAPLVNMGRVGAGRLVAGLDAKSLEYREWRTGVSMSAGLEFEAPEPAAATNWNWSILLQAYLGPAPYGQFYDQNLALAGLGLSFTL